MPNTVTPTQRDGIAYLLAIACFGEGWEEELEWLRAAAVGYPVGTVERYLSTLLGMMNEGIDV